MAAAVMAVQANQKQDLSSHVGRRPSQEHAKIADCTKKLPPRDQWLMEGTLYKRVVQIDVQWHPRKVIITNKHFSITRVGSDDIIEQIDLLEIEGLTTMAEAPDAYGRRGSGDPEILVNLPNADTRPAFVFKVKDAAGMKRRFCFGTESKGETEKWLTIMKQALKSAHDAERKAHYGKWIIQRTHKFYHDPKSQFFLALVIVSNFVMAMLRAQIIPDDTGPFAEDLEILDYAYTGFFICELLVNMVGNWFLPFWMDMWNLFDVVIVLISIISIPLSNVKGFSLLRMMRVFRVVKLFQSLKALRTIITALTKAIVPVANAFFVLAIVTAIYSVVGVGLFASEDKVSFGDFKSSLFTMFQVSTGDGWATSIARPMFKKIGGDSTPQTSVVIFFVSYILVVGTFLLNVVVAVLLDEFISAVQAGKTEQRMSAQAQKKHNTALDPLLATFASCENSKDLSSRIKQVYQVLDGDDSGGLSFEEMSQGLRTRLLTDPIIYLAPENYDAITEQQTLCNADGELDLESFEVVMRKQLDLYAQRRAAFEMAEAEHSQTTVAAILLLLKQLMLTREEGESKKVEAQRRKSLERRSEEGGSPGLKPPLYRHRNNHDSVDRGGRHRQHSSSEGSDYSNDEDASEIEEVAQLEGSVREVQTRMDAVQEDLALLLRTVREGFEQQRRQQTVRPDHLNGSAANYDGIGRKLDEEKEVTLIAVQEVQQRLSTLESRVGSFEGLQRNVGTKILNRVQTMEQRLETVYKGMTKLARGAAAPNNNGEGRALSASASAGGAGSGQPGEAAGLDAREGKSAAGGTAKPRGGKSAGRGGLIAPPQALEISALDEVVYDAQSQFVGAATTQMMLAGMEESRAGKGGRRGSSGQFSAREDPQTSVRMGKDGPLVTAELGYDVPPARRTGSNGAGGRPPFVKAGGGAASDLAVRVSWACTPKALPGMQREPPADETCGGCARCSEGYIGVGCLVCGEKMALVADKDELGGSTIGGLELMVTKASRLLRRYGFTDKVIEPSRFVDSPYGDGRHWFRCFIIAEVGRG